MKKKFNIFLSLILALSAGFIPVFSTGAAAETPLLSKVIGDADVDGSLGVTDATKIQRTLAQLEDEMTPLQRYLSDVDADRAVTIIDVTNIQRKLADLSADFFAETAVSLYEGSVHFSATYASGSAPVNYPIDFRFTTESNIFPIEYRFIIDGELYRDFSEDNEITYTFSAGGSHQFDIAIRDLLGEEISLSWAYDVYASDVDPTTYEDASENEKLLMDMINAYRVENGVGALEIDNELSYIARVKTQDMVDNDYIDHYSPTYGYLDEMLNFFHYPWTMAGENIAYMAPTAQSALQAWKNSIKHNENMLEPKYTKIGVGYVQGSGIWTCLFAK